MTYHLTRTWWTRSLYYGYTTTFLFYEEMEINLRIQKIIIDLLVNYVFSVLMLGILSEDSESIENGTFYAN